MRATTSAQRLLPLRREQRYTVRLDGLLVLGHAHVRLRLLDVSRNGALAEALTPPEPGEDVRLACRGVVRTAHASWVRDARFGLVFAAPLGSAELAALLS